jgi:hypothetical protein
MKKERRMTWRKRVSLAVFVLAVYLGAYYAMVGRTSDVYGPGASWFPDYPGVAQFPEVHLVVWVAFLPVHFVDAESVQSSGCNDQRQLPVPVAS